MAKRDKVELNVYGMEGVPNEVIEEKLAWKYKKKRYALERELKELYKINLDDKTLIFCVTQRHAALIRDLINQNKLLSKLKIRISKNLLKDFKIKKINKIKFTLN